MAASYPGTQPSFTPLVDDVDTVVADQFNQPYLEIEAIASQTGAGEAITAAGGHVLEASDAATNTVTDLHSLEHITSGAAAALFGVGRVTKLEDAGGTKRLTSEEDVIWAEAAAANYLPLKRENMTDAGTVVGYRGFISMNNIGTTPRTIIPDGTPGDVTAILQVSGVVLANDSTVDGGLSMIPNGGSANLYSRDSNTLTLSVAANGSATIVAAGALTYDCVLNLIWI